MVLSCSPATIVFRGRRRSHPERAGEYSLVYGSSLFADFVLLSRIADHEVFASRKIAASRHAKDESIATFTAYERYLGEQLASTDAAVSGRLWSSRRSSWLQGCAVAVSYVYTLWSHATCGSHELSPQERGNFVDSTVPAGGRNHTKGSRQDERDEEAASIVACEFALDLRFEHS